MERFDELKSKILRVAKDQSACSEQYKRAYAAETMAALCGVIKDNFHWCCNNEVLTGALIDEFKADFAGENIFHNENVSGAYLIASGQSTVEAYDQSTVRAYDQSTVRAYDQSTVRASGQSTVRASGQSTVEAYDQSYINSFSSIECKISENAILRHNSVVTCCGKTIKTD